MKINAVDFDAIYNRPTDSAPLTHKCYTNRKSLFIYLFIYFSMFIPSKAIETQEVTGVEEFKNRNITEERQKRRSMTINL